MTSAAMYMHILDRVDYSKHRLVSLPVESLPRLPPSSIRLQSKILGLTTNNLTYARNGHLLGWWDVYRQPNITPAPYDDQEAYGRISAWGYAEIIDSTVSSIPVGSTVYGYLPISTFPEDVQVAQTGMKDQIIVTSEHRQHLWPIYNRYKTGPPLAELEKTKTVDALGWDVLMQQLFGTAYNMNKYAFAWEDKLRIHPSGRGEWTSEDANLDDAAVVILNASGKTGMSFAYTLRNNRPREHQPKTIVGIGSPSSVDMLKNSGWYDKVMLNSDDQAAKDFVNKSGSRRIVVFDFGAREGARNTWRATLSSSSIPSSFISVGSEVKVRHPDEGTKQLRSVLNNPDSPPQVNANELREKGIKLARDAYFDEYYRTWDECKRRGGLSGVELAWSEGMEAWEKGWEDLCKDKVPPSHGLVYRL